LPLRRRVPPDYCQLSLKRKRIRHEVHEGHEEVREEEGVAVPYVTDEVRRSPLRI
jgi:hypothetical protein